MPPTSTTCVGSDFPDMATIMDKVLPDLRSRGEIQSYLKTVEKEVGGALSSPHVAAELDKRDQLAGFREKFEVPKIGKLLDENERDKGVVLKNRSRFGRTI